MEPLDEEAAERVDVYSETVGSKKPRRRLSSILKGQRTTVTAREEVDKGVEKRLSRRVSFAPANKVLLFSDALDTLSSSADDAHRRLQAAITQPLTDMETFLNDPLPAAQQRTREKSGVYCDTQDDYGERTMIFSGDCAGYMDMTHCNTVLISDDDLGPHALFPEYNVNVPTRGNLDFTFSISKGDAKTPVKIPSSDHGLPPEYENVFAYPVTKVVHNAAASLQEDQTRDQGADVDPTAFLLAKIRMRRSAVDNENQHPVFTSTMMEQPQGQSSNVEKASNVFEAESETEFTTSQTRAGQSASKDCIGMEGTRHITAQSDDMDITRSRRVAIDGRMFPIPTVRPLQNEQRLRLSFKTTAANTTCSEFDMDMTRSQTVAIDAEEVYPHPIYTICQTVSNGNQRRLTFTTPSQPADRALDGGRLKHMTKEMEALKRTEDDSDDMEFTCRTGVAAINADSADMDIPRCQAVAINAEEVYPHPIKNRKSLAFVTPSNMTCNEFDMDMTRSQTVAINAEEVYPHPIKNRKSLAFVTPSIMTCNEFDMDMTRSRTVAVGNQRRLTFTTPSQPADRALDGGRLKHMTEEMEALKRTEDDSDDMEFTCRTGVAAINADMDMPRCQAVAINAEEVYPHPIKNRKSLAFVTPSNMTCNEFDMDMTRSQTVAVPAELDDMSMPICQTVSIGNQRRLTFTTPSQPADRALDAGRLKYMTEEMEALKRTEDDNDDMEFTCHTGVVEAEHLDIVSSTEIASQNMCHFPRNKTSTEEHHVYPQHLTKTGRVFYLDAETTRVSPTNQAESGEKEMEALKRTEDDSDDMEFTCHTGVVAINADSADMDMTRRPKVQAVQLERLDAPVEAACHGREMVPLPHAPESEEMHQRTDPEQSQASGPTTAPHNVERSAADAKTKRLSLVDLRSKLKRISLSIKNDDAQHRKMLNMASSTIPVSHSEQALDANATKTISLPIVEPDSEAAQNDGPTDDGGGEVPREEFPGEERSAVTPLNLRSTRLAPRLSMGRFTPKLPQRNKPPQTNRLASSTVRQTMFQGTHQLSSDMLMQQRDGGIHDEVMPDWALDTEDLSELLEAGAPQWNGEERHPLHVVPDAVPRKNVTTPEQHDPQDEQRRPSIDCIQEMVPSSVVTDGIRITASGNTTRPIDTAASGITTTWSIDTAASGITTTLSIDTAASGITTTWSIDTAASGITTRPIDTAASGITTRPIDTAASGNTTRPIDTAASGITTRPIDPAASGITTQPIDTAASGITTRPIDTAASGITTTWPIDTAASGITTTWPIDTAASGITTTRPIDTAASGITTRPIDTAASGITTWSIDPAASGITTTQSIDTAASGTTTQSIDYSRSNSSSMASLGSEAAAESSYKSSLVESHLEDVTDWGNTLHKKLEDENMTVLEFFKYFGVDFVFCNHRQSVTPANLASDLDCKPDDLLRLRHIDHPKGIVYANDHKHLAETMEGLRVRKRDKDHLVRNVNGPLWKAVRDFSEKELQCFGAKLKEKRKFFRRRAKVQSHEVKGVLYSTLHHAYQEELLKLREKNSEADKMVEVMDDCIHDLQTCLDAVEGNDLNNSGPTLASRQQELEKVNTKLADGEREMCELELQNKQKKDKLSRLRAEMGHLRQSSTTLEMLNEWKLKEETGKHAVYTFVYNTMHLDVEFEEAHGDLTDERNISNITLTLVQLDDKKSKCHARLVHKLLSQYIEANSALKDKYPTRRYVPRLLHSVSVTAARLCLLGMEVDLMAKWGAQRLNLLEISCEDTRVCLLFSSLKAFAKFQLSVEVTPDYPLCTVRLCSFTNRFGSTTRSQIEELVGSVEQGKNMLTKIVKRINDTLLC